jgi:hypothetical protein
MLFSRPDKPEVERRLPAPIKIALAGKAFINPTYFLTTFC